MQNIANPKTESRGNGPGQLRLARLASNLPAFLAVTAGLMACAAFLSGAALCGQTPPAQAPAAPGITAPGTHAAAATKPKTHSKSSTPATVTTASVTAPAVPADPPPPNWPANDKPSEASITWDSQGLRIVASNSSLADIFREVSTITGTQIEGMGPDQRIFGTYGPGPVSEVLSELLDGSGYNVLMIGDLGQGAPRQIVLSPPPTGPAPPVVNSPAEDEPPLEEAQQPEPPPVPQAAPTTPAPGMPVRTPQQIVQEMQQRQQQLQQMQQQQQQNNPQN